MRKLINVLFLTFLICIPQIVKAGDTNFVDFSNIIIPDSVSFFAGSHPTLFITNRILTSENFGSVVILDNFGSMVTIDNRSSSIERQRTRQPLLLRRRRR